MDYVQRDVSFTLSHNNKVKEYKSQRGKSWPWYETCHWVALFQILQFWSKRQISRKGGMNGKKQLSVVWKQTANTDVGPQFRSDIDSNGYTVQHKGEGKKGGHLEQVEYKGVFHYSENVDVAKVKAWNPSLKGHIMNPLPFPGETWSFQWKTRWACVSRPGQSYWCEPH